MRDKVKNKSENFFGPPVDLGEDGPTESDNQDDEYAKRLALKFGGSVEDWEEMLADMGSLDKYELCSTLGLIKEKGLLRRSWGYFRIQWARGFGPE